MAIVRTVSFAMLLVLSACAPNADMMAQQHAVDVQRVLKAELEACNWRYPSPDAKPAVPRVTCIGEAEVRFFEALKHRDVDVARVLAAKRVAAAQRYDSGQITLADYALAVEEARSSATSQSMARQNSAVIAGAADRQANAAAALAAPRYCQRWHTLITCF